MNYQEFFHHWNQVHDVTLRLIKQIPENKLDFKLEGMEFTLEELIAHIFYIERKFSESGRRRKLDREDASKTPTEKDPRFTSVQELYDYAREVHEETNELFAGRTREELEQKVQTPWGEDTLFMHIHSAYEYHWHIRGQVYLYLQLLGVKNLVDVFDYRREKAFSYR